MEILNKDEQKMSGLLTNTKKNTEKFRYNQRKTGVNDLFSKKSGKVREFLNFELFSLTF